MCELAEITPRPESARRCRLCPSGPRRRRARGGRDGSPRFRSKHPPTVSASRPSGAREVAQAGRRGSGPRHPSCHRPLKASPIRESPTAPVGPPCSLVDARGRRAEPIEPPPARSAAPLELSNATLVSTFRPSASRERGRTHEAIVVSEQHASRWGPRVPEHRRSRHSASPMPKRRSKRPRRSGPTTIRRASFICSRRGISSRLRRS